jgi:putative hydrolase of the HAD superfamily
VSLTHVFFDVGGVLGSNGWDHDERAVALAQFDLDPDEFADRHDEAVGIWESGGMSLGEYLDATVFFRPRPFTRDAFIACMLAQSAPYPDTIALARELAGAGRWHLMTLNNESAELNRHRIEVFGLTAMFEVFFSSCWMGVLKPSRIIYERALAMTQVPPANAVFIDDRARNLDVPRALGMRTIHYRDATHLRRALAALGVAP